MIDRTTKLRWRRRVRRSKRQVETIGEQAEQHLERHVIRRLNRLWNVRRFLLTWLFLMIIIASMLIVQARGLSQYYQSVQPIPGGTYNEGIVGTFTNANPIYATGQVDASVSHLVFSGLLKYDNNNRLINDLAEKWQVNERGNIYTITLRDGLVWHDGIALNADDVVFTYATIQNPDAKSVLANSWKGVKVAKVNNRTVTFTLPQALSSFPYSLTNGLIPKHVLQGIPPSQLRSVSFNVNHPIGSGPFKWQALEVSGTTPEDREERVALTPFDKYIAGKPKLEGFVIRAFHNEKHMIDSFKNHELEAMVGLDSVPDELSGKVATREYSFPLTSATMVFFKTSDGVLVDPKVRKALIQSADVKAIAKSLGYPLQLVKEPLLRAQVGYNGNYVQLPYDKATAQRLLDEAGWKMGPNGLRVKDGKPLTFRIFSESTPEYAQVTSQLQKQWRDIGVDGQFILQSASDLQTTVAFHTYDALLYGISVGVDPDVFAYWHSSQADIRSPNRLNFSEYKSNLGDRALEAGRTRSDNSLRAVKYQPFLESWRNDAPALGLYQPRFLYITSQTIAGLHEHPINTGVDRYTNVNNWMIRTKLVDAY